MKFDETATVVSQNEISDGIYDMWIDTGIYEGRVKASAKTHKHLRD